MISVDICGIAGEENSGFHFQLSIWSNTFEIRVGRPGPAALYSESSQVFFRAVTETARSGAGLQGSGLQVDQIVTGGPPG